jgi:gliding motility-associated-like protein
MIVKIKRIILLLLIICLPIETVFSQHSSKNNYTGAWETPTSWIPTWAVPQTTNINNNITIYGLITRNGSLTFPDNSANLIVSDTLVIKGTLTIGHNDHLTVSDNGILIIRGNLILDDDAIIDANGYLIVTGDIDKIGGTSHQYIRSNDNPVKVFIGGTIDAALRNKTWNPVLECTTQPSLPYPISGCSYGNMADLMNDAIYPFFQTTCTIATPTITAGGPTTFCAGGSVTLTSSSGTSYLWSDGETTQSINVTAFGTFTVVVTNASGCQSAVSTATVVTVNAIPMTPTITSGGPTTFCDGGNVTLSSSAETSYLWSNSSTSSSINVTTAGNYSVQVTNTSGCLSAASGSVAIVVNTLPVVSTGNNGPVCAGSALSLTGGPVGMVHYYWSGPGEFSSILQNPLVTDRATSNMAGNYTLIVANTNGCTNTAAQNIVVNAAPIAVAGPDQELKFTFETQMNAVLSLSETGEWSLISGSGHISDINSPTTRITELSIGENKFLWKVLNGSCEDTSQVKIKVFDVFIPSVITPNGDGKNDYFKISESSGKVELIIFNRWGNEEYSSGNYLNDWDGRNNKGVELPNDTYFYILKFENGRVLKGSVFIKR